MDIFKAEGREKIHDGWIYIYGPYFIKFEAQLP
jgi:hypothetical protein